MPEETTSRRSKRRALKFDRFRKVYPATLIIQSPGLGMGKPECLLARAENWPREFCDTRVGSL